MTIRTEFLLGYGTMILAMFGLGGLAYYVCVVYPFRCLGTPRRKILAWSVPLRSSDVSRNLAGFLAVNRGRTLHRLPASFWF